MFNNQNYKEMNYLIMFVKELSDEPLMWIVYAGVTGFCLMIGVHKIATNIPNFKRFLGVEND